MKTRAAFCFLDEKNKIIELRPGPAIETAQVWPTIRNLAGKFGKGADRLAIVLSSKFAKTLHTTVSILRNFKDSPITLAELEDLIAQGLWKIFDRDREKLASLLDLAPLEVAILDARILGFKLDGYRLIQPIGFSARTVELELSLTAASKEIVNGAQELESELAPVLIEEQSVVMANALAGLDAKDFILAAIFDYQTELVIKRGHWLRYGDLINWGTQSLLTALQTELAISEPLAREILEKLKAREISLALERKLSQILLAELKTIFYGIKNQPGLTAKEKIYLAFLSPLAPPDKLAASVFRSATIVNKKFLSERGDFQVQLEGSQNEQNYLSLMLSALAVIKQPLDKRVQILLRRRVRWMQQS